MVTGTVGLAGVDAAFEALGDPETHAKILIDPRSSVVVPTALVRERGVSSASGDEGRPDGLADH